MVAYITRMPAGIPGNISRTDSLTVQQEMLDTSNLPAFGGFVKLVSGRIQAIASGDAATVIYGLLVRSFPTQSPTNAFGAASPIAGDLVDVMRRGYMQVALAAGTAAKGAQVFVRVTAGSGRAVGAIETVADSGNCVAVANCFFMGPADASGNVEIAFNI